MTLNLSPAIEAELLALATLQKRDLKAVIAEALNDYILATSITDLSTAEIDEGQMKMLTDLDSLDGGWQEGDV
jgi:predicted transcriptional regulator